MDSAVMSQTVRLELPDQAIDLPIVVGTEDEHAVDTSKLRAQTGYIALDEGYRNTGACQSAITFIDGENGVLRYRGYAIEQVAKHLTFIETAMLLIHGELPTRDQIDRFRDLLTREQTIPENLKRIFTAFPPDAPPMAMLSATINAASTYYPQVTDVRDQDAFELGAARLLSKSRTLAAALYKTQRGEPLIYPKPELSYCANFLHMMFSLPYAEIEEDLDAVRALNLLLLLHADHEQNCSTSTVRMVGSSGASLFASCAAGVCALWGPLHGGANVAVLNQLQAIHRSGQSPKEFIEKIKNDDERLFGFGHAVYKNFDPRARILKESADKILAKLTVHDPLLDIARHLEEAALSDDYFVQRKLYPNVDFYSGILMRAMGVPVNMFTVIFALGRMAGWIANWKEVRDNDSRIYRPRQIYTGPNERTLTPVEQR